MNSYLHERLTWMNGNEYVFSSVCPLHNIRKTCPLTLFSRNQQIHTNINLLEFLSSHLFLATKNYKKKSLKHNTNRLTYININLNKFNSLMSHNSLITNMKIRLTFWHVLLIEFLLLINQLILRFYENVWTSTSQWSKHKNLKITTRIL